jgi:hypothetical protein
MTPRPPRMDAVLRRHDPTGIATGLRPQLELPSRSTNQPPTVSHPSPDLRAPRPDVSSRRSPEGGAVRPQNALLRPCHRDSSGETLVSTAVGPYSHGGSQGPPSTSRRIAGQLSETGRFRESRPSPAARAASGVQNPCPKSTSHIEGRPRVLQPLHRAGRLLGACVSTDLSAA